MQGKSIAGRNFWVMYTTIKQNTSFFLQVSLDPFQRGYVAKIQYHKKYEFGGHFLVIKLDKKFMSIF